ncbi:MAG: PGF-pre-PGF domain-containing protein, partial [Methanosarcina sp.]
ADEVYKFLNIWVGKNGFANPNNIENPVVCFKVEKSWIKDENIDQASITMNRYTDNKWVKLSTNLSGEDENSLYFIAQPEGFSFFAITGKPIANDSTAPSEILNKTQSSNDKLSVDGTQNKSPDKISATKVEQTSEQKKSSNTYGEKNMKTPAFELLSCIFCLLGVFLYVKIKRR